MRATLSKLTLFKFNEFHQLGTRTIPTVDNIRQIKIIELLKSETTSVKIISARLVSTTEQLLYGERPNMKQKSPPGKLYQALKFAWLLMVLILFPYI